MDWFLEGSYILKILKGNINLIAPEPPTRGMPVLSLHGLVERRRLAKDVDVNSGIVSGAASEHATSDADCKHHDNWL